MADLLFQLSNKNKKKRYQMVQRSDKGFDFYDGGQKINIDDYVKATGSNKQQLVNNMASRGDRVSQQSISQPKIQSSTVQTPAQAISQPKLDFSLKKTSMSSQPNTNVGNASDLSKRYKMQQRLDKGFDFYEDNKKVDIDTYVGRTGVNKDSLRQNMADRGDVVSQTEVLRKNSPGVSSLTYPKANTMAQKEIVNQNKQNKLAQRKDQLNELVTSADSPSKQIKLGDMAIGGNIGNKSINQLAAEYSSAKGMDQVNIRRNAEKVLNDLGQDYSDEAELKKYQIQLALQEMQDTKKNRTVGSTLNEAGNALLVDPIKNTGSKLADIADAFTGRRQKLSQNYSNQASEYYSLAAREISNGNKSLGQWYAAKGDELNRQASRAIDSQIESSDPISAAGTIATAAAMPFAYAAQGSGTANAAKVGATGSTTKAATTKIGQLIFKGDDVVTKLSPNVTSKLANTTAGKVLNSTPVQLAADILPNASSAMQALAGEAAANVLSGIPLSVSQTASIHGSSGKLENYLAEAGAGAVLDAVTPLVAAGLGKAARYGINGIRQSQDAAIQQLIKQGYSPASSRRIAKEGGYIGGKNATGFADAEAKGRVFTDTPDGQPRFEGDDSEAVVQPKTKLDELASNDPYMIYEGKLTDVLDHPELYEQYPELKDVTVHYDSEVRDYYGAFYDPATNEITIGAGLNDSQIKTGLLHEIQHAIQEREDFASGTSPAMAGSLDKYNLNAGEAEARAVGSRVDMPENERYVGSKTENSANTNDIRSTFYDSLDVPKDDLIVRQKGGSTEQALSVIPDNIRNMGRKVYETLQPYFGKKERKSVYLNTINNKTVGAARAAGVDVSNYRHEIDSWGIRHILKNHGENGSKLRFGDIPVTQKDIELIPDILLNPDKVYPSDRKTTRGRSAIVYEKQYEGRAYYIEQINKESQTLRTQTMYIRETPGVTNQLSLPGDHGPARLPSDTNNISKDIENINSSSNATVDQKLRKRQIKTAIDDIIYDQNPDIAARAYSEDMNRSLSEDGTTRIPRVHADDLKHYLGNISENIPNAYKRLTGERDIDLLAQRAGFDDVDDFLDVFQQQIETRSNNKEALSKLRNLRQDPDIIRQATNKIDSQASSVISQIESLKTERKNNILSNNLESVERIEHTIKNLAQEAGIKNVKLSKKRKISVAGPKGKLTEYAAVTANTADDKLKVELIPLDNKKHTLKNGMVVDKSGRSVGSYVGIDELGQQYAYIKGKPVNITGITGDIDAWGNLNKASWDIDRLIEANAPDKATARKVQQFTTTFKDQQEAAMKTELVRRRVKLQEVEKQLVDNLPKKNNKKQLTQDLFRAMEKKMTVNELYERYGREYVEKQMRPAVQWARKHLDAILKETNTVLEQNGYEPIPRRKNYISHIQDNPTFWSKVGIGIQDITNMGKSIDSDANPGKTRGGIPDDIVGKTANTSARRKWNPFAQTRKGSAHKQDFFEALDSYYEPMLFNKYMTPAASRTRVIERTFRAFEKAKEIKYEQMAEIVGTAQARDSKLSAKKINRNHKEGRRSPLVIAWQEYGNMLAGKTNALDRSLIDNFGQGGTFIMDASTKLQGIAGANTIPGSATTALAQTLSVPQTIARDSISSVLKGAKEMMRWGGVRNTSADPLRRSSFMRARYTDASSLRKTAVRKYTNLVSKPMDAIERFTGEFSWRSAYAEAQKKGLTGMSAVREADIQTKKTLAGRGIGDRPVVMNSKALGALTQFGLEVNNMRVQFFKDFTPTQKVKFLVGAYALNQAYQLVAGQSPLPDYIDSVIDSVVDIAKGAEDTNNDGETNVSVGSKLAKSGQRIVGETAKFIPGAGPVANLLPEKTKEAWFGSESDVSRYGNMAAVRSFEAAQKAFEGVIEGDIAKIIDSGLMVIPTGQQIRRTAGGLDTMAKGVAKTSSGNLTTEVDNSNPLKWVQAGLFGKNALSEIKDFYDNNSFATNKNQTDTYNSILESGGRDAANEYLRSIKGISGDKNTKADMAKSTELLKLQAEAKRKLSDGSWKLDNGLVVNKSGDVQRDYYKGLAEASTLQDDDTYNNYLKAYNIGNTSSRTQIPKDGNNVLANLEKESDKVDRAAASTSLMKDDKYVNVPDWVKERYYEESGYTKDQVGYAAKASYSASERMNAYWRPLAQSSDTETLIQELYNGRLKSIKGDYWATTGIIDNLRKEGFIGYADAKALKSITLNGNGSGSSSSSSSKSSSDKSYQNLINATKTTNKMEVPSVDKISGLSSANTKKSMQSTTFKKWSSNSSNKNKKEKITIKKEKNII